MRAARPLRVPLVREEMIWAAGFFEGEGGTYATNSRKNGVVRPSLCVVLTQANPDPKDPLPAEVLTRFMYAVGGLGIIKREQRRKITSPRRKPQWRYVVTDFEQAQAIVAMMWPWLGEVKKTQAKIALGKVRAYRVSRPRQLHLSGVSYQREASGK